VSKKKVHILLDDKPCMTLNLPFDTTIKKRKLVEAKTGLNLGNLLLAERQTLLENSENDEIELNFKSISQKVVFFVKKLTRKAL
jgi:hypothetical protein